MGAPVENETVFVRVVVFDSNKNTCFVVREARVLHQDRLHYAFGVAGVNGGGYGTRRIADEGITWARPEQADALRVTVALSS